jgi:hypothetical protein
LFSLAINSAHIRELQALDRVEDDQGFAENRAGAARHAEVRKGAAEIAERSALATPVTNLSHYREALLVMLDGMGGMPRSA